jgi:bifunctional DNA-binding transcriptional regulator/antitoxin component of YhaV-PrlF toxin-antitoxin module
MSDSRAASDTVHLRARGVLTLPKALRDRYALGAGDRLHVVDLGGAFVLTPSAPLVPALARDIERMREDAGLSADELLARLQAERVRLVRERYGEEPDAPPTAPGA